MIKRKENQKQCEVRGCKSLSVGRKKPVDSDLYGIIVPVCLCEKHKKETKNLFWCGRGVKVKKVGWEQVDDLEI